MEGIGEEILKLLQSQLIDIHLFGLTIQISQSVIVTWIIMAFLIIFSIIFTRNLKAVPEGKQNFIEVVVEFINNFAKDILGHHWKMFAPYIGTVLLFLVISNTISIFNIIPSGEDLNHIFHTEAFKNMPEFHLLPPTKNASVALAFAIMSMIVVLTAGIKVKRVSGWLKSFLEPVPILLPFKILDYFIRPISLCFRQFGNILGAAIIMELLYISIPMVLPGLVSVYFDIFDGILQAYVFCFLTSLYIAEAIE